MSIFYTAIALGFAFIHVTGWLMMVIAGVFMAPVGVLAKKWKLETLYLVTTFLTILNWLSGRTCIFNTAERYFRDLAYPGVSHLGYVEVGLRIVHINPEGLPLFIANSIFITIGLAGTLFWHARSMIVASKQRRDGQ